MELQDKFLPDTSITFHPKLQKIFGFMSAKYVNADPAHSITVISENGVDISSIFSINLMCDIILGWYQEGRRRSILYTFPYGKVPFGYRIVQEVNTLYYMSLNTKTINSIEFCLVDQDGNEVDFNGEPINFSLHRRQL